MRELTPEQRFTANEARTALRVWEWYKKSPDGWGVATFPEFLMYNNDEVWDLLNDEPDAQSKNMDAMRDIITP